MYALTTHQLQVERRESHRRTIKRMRLTTKQLQVERSGRGRESHRANQAYALTTNQAKVGEGESIEAIKRRRSPHRS